MIDTGTARAGRSAVEQSPLGTADTVDQPLAGIQNSAEQPVVAQQGVPEQIQSATGLDPLILVAGAVVAIALLVVLWRVVAWFRRPKGRRFRDALQKVDSVSVLMHPNPDPDAMSCAIGVARLAEATDTDVDIQYPGRIQHQENRAFETVLDLNLERIESAGELTADEVVLVDHNVPRGFAGADSVEPYAVVDHHPGDGEGRAFTDVRPDYGACASILTEYFEDLGARVVGPNEEPPDGTALTLSPTLNTGMLYGIQSDTNHLTKGCSPAEFDACEFLFGGIDEEILDRIANPQVDAEVLDVKARAIRGRDVDGPFAVADVGEVSNVDAIPQSADELIRLEGVTAVVVYGERDGTIHLSGRSRDDRVHMGNALSAVVDDVPMAGAGGHARMGGGQIPVEHLEGIGPKQTGLTVTDVKQRLFDAMRGEIQ